MKGRILCLYQSIEVAFRYLLNLFPIICIFRNVFFTSFLKLSRSALEIPRSLSLYFSSNFRFHNACFTLWQSVFFFCTKGLVPVCVMCGRSKYLSDRVFEKVQRVFEIVNYLSNYRLEINL